MPLHLRALLLFASQLGLAFGAAAQNKLAPGAIEALPVPLASHPKAIAQGVSADGERVVGVAFPESFFDLDGPPTLRPFVWTRDAGYRMIDLPDSLVSLAVEVTITGDGETVAGQFAYDAAVDRLQIRMIDRAFRWTEAEGLSWLSVPGAYRTGVRDGYQAKAVAASTDGRRLLGSLWTNAADTRTVVWEDDGRWTAVDPPASFATISARDLSADGSVGVGAAYRDRVGFPRTAFRWTEGRGSEVIAPVADAYERSDAVAVSADGSTVVGYAYDGPTRNIADSDAFRVRDGELAILGPWLPRDVSADGSVVVGGSGRAIVWVEGDVARYLDTLVDAAGWRLERAVAVSADGTIVVGTGTAPDGRDTSWRARLPARDGG